MPTPTDIGFRIKPIFMGQAATAEGKRFGTLLRGFDTSMKAAQLSGERMLRSMQSGMMALGRAAQVMGSGLRTAFSGGMSAMQRFSTGVDSLLHKVFNLRNVIAGGIVSGMAYRLITRTLHAGSEDLAIARRMRRQFGSDANMVQERASRAASRVGLDDTGAAQALTPIYQAILATSQIGNRNRGRRIRTAGDLAVARADALETSASLFERAMALNHNLNPQDLGIALASAGTSEMAQRQLSSMLDLPRGVVAKFFQANKQAGGLYKFLGKEKADRFGIRKGEKAAMGPMWNAIFEASGLTDRAANEEMATFQGQVHRISGMLETQIGQIGAKAWEKLNAALGKGTNLADKLEQFLKSDKGKEFVDKLASGLAKAVESVAKLAQQIPMLFDKMAQHKDLLKWVAILGGGAYVGGKLSGMFRGMFGGAKEVAGALGAGGKGAAIPVEVVNWPGAGAGDAISGGVDPLMGGAKQAGKGLLRRVGGKVAGALGTISGRGLLGAAGEVAAPLTFLAATVGPAMVALSDLNPKMGKVRSDLAGQLSGERQGRIEAIIRSAARTQGMGDDAFSRELGGSLSARIGQDPLLGMVSKAARGDQYALDDLTRNNPQIAKLVTDYAKGQGINLEVKIETPYLANPVEFVDMLMPHMKNGLLRQLAIANAAGR